MGSSQKVAEKKLHRFLKVGAYVTVPLIAFGAITIFFQLFNGSKGEFGLYDFDLGKLWPWNEAVAERVEERPAISLTPERPRRSARIAAPVTRHKEAVRSVRNVARKVSSTKRTTAPMQIEKRTDFERLQLDEIDKAELFLLEESMDVSNLSEREYLVPKHLKLHRKRFAIGASFAPSYSYRRFGYRDLSRVARIEDQMAYTYGQTKTYRNETDGAILNFYSGLDVYMHVSDRITVQSGVYYTTFGEQMQVVNRPENRSDIRSSLVEENDPFKAHDALYCSPETQEATMNEVVPFNNYFAFVEIPVNIAYKLTKLGGTAIEAQAGLSYAYMVQSDALMYNYSNNEYHWISDPGFQYLNRQFLFANTGVIMSQYFSKQVELFLNPQFKYALTSTFSEDYELEQNQLSIGMRLGMKVHL